MAQIYFGYVRFFVPGGTPEIRVFDRKQFALAHRASGFTEHELWAESPEHAERWLKDYLGLLSEVLAEN